MLIFYFVHLKPHQPKQKEKETKKKTKKGNEKLRFKKLFILVLGCLVFK